MKKFIGRVHELSVLERYQQHKSASLIVIRGRRRIGKSRLAEECAKGFGLIKISGLPPTDNPSAQDQRKHVADMLVRLGFSRPADNDWYNIFLHLAQHLPNERTVLLLADLLGEVDSECPLKYLIFSIYRTV